MIVTAEDVHTLVRIVGRRGAQAALSRSDIVRADDLREMAESLGLSVQKRAPKSEVANAVIRHVDRRITKSLDELKQLSVAEILQYFVEIDPDGEEVIDLLKSIDIRNRSRSRKELFEFAANQINSLGIFERLARPTSPMGERYYPTRRRPL